MAKRKAKGDSDQIYLELPVSYGNVSIGDQTIRLSLTVNRSKLPLSSADKVLCGKRLEGTILARSGDGQAEQKSLEGIEDADIILTGTFDVKRFSVSGKNISFGLTFNKNSVDKEKLACFAQREGMFTVEGIGSIPGKAKAKAPPAASEDEEGEDSEDE